MTKEEIIKYFNDLKIKQETIGFIYSLSEEVYDSYFLHSKIVASGLNVDIHRWYEISTTVFKVDDWYLGIEHICQVFSEEMEAEDVGFILNFFEMEQVPTVTYVRKND